MEGTAGTRLAPDLLFLIVRLYEYNYDHICWGAPGNKTDQFPVKMGVRQGCVLAPTLFSLLINGIISFLASFSTDAPVLAGTKIPIIMFADDTLILSKTLSGLQHSLLHFEEFCLLPGLTVNSSNKSSWPLNHIGHLMGGNGWATRGSGWCITYLGITLHKRLSWRPHIDTMALKHMQLAGAMKKGT